MVSFSWIRETRMRSLLPLGGVIVAGLLLAGCGSGQNSGPAAGSPVADPAPAALPSKMLEVPAPL